MFIYYYSQIVNILSASSVRELFPQFVQNGIILCENQEEIFNMSSPTKAIGLLLSPISSALMSRRNKGFYKFLDIAEQCGKCGIKELISTIRKKLFELRPEDKGTYNFISICDRICENRP